MKNIDFLKKYQQLQYEIMFDDLVDLNYAISGFSRLDKTAFWNFSLIFRNINEKELFEIEENMKSMDRKPVIYVENAKDFLETVEILRRNEYHKLYEDSWMFWEGGKFLAKDFFKLKKLKVKKI